MADLQSFEVAEGDTFGDLLSADRIRSRQPIKVGLLAGGFFEYWRMYPETLKEAVLKDSGVVLDRLSANHEVVFPGLVDDDGRVFHTVEVCLDSCLSSRPCRAKRSRLNSL